jgi:hypothetical protein
MSLRLLFKIARLLAIWPISVSLASLSPRFFSSRYTLRDTIQHYNILIYDYIMYDNLCEVRDLIYVAASENGYFSLR